MESGVDDVGLHSPLLGDYTATEAPPNTPHGAQGSSTTPSGLPHGSGLGQDPQQPHAQHHAQPQFQQQHGSPHAMAYAPNAPFNQAMPNGYSQPTVYNGTPQMHGHSIAAAQHAAVVQHSTAAHACLCAMVHRRSYTTISNGHTAQRCHPTSAPAAAPRASRSHGRSVDAHRPAVWHARSNHAKCIHGAPAWVGPTPLSSHAA